MSQLFILFVGFNRVGKTTMSRAAEELLMRGCRRRVVTLSFGTRLRDELVKYYGVPAEIVYDKDIDKDATMFRLGDYSYDPSMPKLWKKFGLIAKVGDFSKLTVSLRELLIHHGTNIRRAQDVDYWVKEFGKVVDEDYSKYDVILVDDCRFASEAAYFVGKHSLMFHLTNGTTKKLDQPEAATAEMINSISDQLIPIETTIPLLRYTAEQLVKEAVMPRVRKFKT